MTSRIHLYSCLFLIVVSTTLLAQSNPVPFINQPLTPSRIVPGGAGFTLTVNGAGFTPTSVIRWNGRARSTTFVSATQLATRITERDIARPTTASVVVTDATGGASSNVTFLPISHPSHHRSFTSRRVPVVGHALSVNAADFNADNKIDLAVISTVKTGTQTEAHLFVLLGRGDGIFQQKGDYVLGVGGEDNWALITGDFNGDAKVDIAVANHFSGAITVFLGNGDGTFRTGVNSAADARFLVAGDFNQDGYLDIAAVANSTSGTSLLEILLGNGDGTFRKGPSHSIAGEATGVEVADFNGDGKLDLAVSNKVGSSTGSLSVFLGNGNGSMRKRAIYTLKSPPIALAIADLNGGGKLDLVTANTAKSGSVSVLHGNGDGTFQQASVLFSGKVSALGAGDFNSEAKIRLMVSTVPPNGAPRLQVLQGTETSAARVQGWPAFSSRARSLAVADFNADGKLDVAAAHDDGTVSVDLQDGPLQISPDYVDFGSQMPNTTVGPDTLTLSNSGSSALSVTGITINEGDGGSDFSEQNNCGSTLVTSCSINVRFSLTMNDYYDSGYRYGDLTVTATDASNTTYTLDVTLNGEILVGYMEALPDNIANFGSVVINDQNGTFVTATLTNTGPGMAWGWDEEYVIGGGFGLGGGCIQVILFPGDTCDVTEVFYGQRGFNSASLYSSNSDCMCGSDWEVGLVAWGNAASLSATSLAFGAQPLRTISAPRSITLTVADGGALNISSIVSYGDFVESDNCRPAVAGFGTCTINVGFRPTAAGKRTGNLTITDDGGTSPQIIALSGIGGAAVYVDPAVLDFGYQKVGATSASKMMALNNTSSSQLTAPTVQVTGDYSITANSCTKGVKPNTHCNVSVAFTPHTSGVLKGTLTFADNANSSPQRVGLQGKGSLLVVSPDSDTFIPQPLGTSSGIKIISVTNRGSTAVTINSIVPSGDFVISATTKQCPSTGTLGSGITCFVAVKFAAKALGARNGAITIRNSDPASPHKVALTGTGTAVKLSAKSWNFGSVNVASSNSQTFKLTNASTTTLTISSITLGGVNAIDFSETDTCSGNLAAGQSCTISITFTPTDVGTRKATVVISDDGGGSPQDIALTGTGS